MTPQEFKDWRARLGLTQARAGAALGKNRRTIAAYEGAANWRGNRIEIPLAVELACKWLEEQYWWQKKRMNEATEIVNSLPKRN